MKEYVYFTVKITIVVYIMYKVWLLLFRDRLFGLWDRLFAKTKPQTITIPKKRRVAGESPAVSVMSKVNHDLLTDPRKAEPEPVATTDLESTGFIGQEEPVTADDVDTPEPPYIPSEDELDMAQPDDNAMSSGVTFQEIENAVDVLKNGSQDEAACIDAARTVYDIQNTQIFDYITREVCQIDKVLSLMEEHLDGDGFPLKKRNPLTDFDIENYV